MEEKLKGKELFCEKLKEDPAYKLSCVLDHATGGRMSKTNYDLTLMYAEIDSYQSESYYSIVKDDVNMLIKNGADLEEILKYINNLV